MLQSIVWFFINGLTRAAFMDLGRTPRYNDLLTIFVFGLIRTSRESFTNKVNCTENIFSNCLISVSVKGSNVSTMDMLDFSTNCLPCDKVLEWNLLCIFKMFWQKKVLQQWAIFISELILFGRKQSFDFNWMLWSFYYNIPI